MDYYTKKELLTEAKGNTRLLELNSNDASIIISEFGGRVLGAFPKNDSVNLLWLPADLNGFIQDKYWNIGGDRYWIGPQKLFFDKNPETYYKLNPEHFIIEDDFLVPRGLDPANYEIKSSTETGCILSSNISITNQLNLETYEGIIKRSVSLITEPVKTGVPHFGIKYIEDCMLSTPNLEINGWSLTQIISGGHENPGTVLIPTNANPNPLSYFRNIPEDRLKVKDNYVAFKIDVNDIYKLAIRPEDIDNNQIGKIGYVLRIPESIEYCFLIKLSSDLPKIQTEIFDTSRDHPDLETGCIQAYNSESPEESQLSFGEIEFQLIPFKTTPNRSESLTEHQLFGYMAPKEEILNVIEKYLGILDPVLF